MPSPCSSPAGQLCGGGKDARNTHTPAAGRPALSCALPLSLPSLSVTQARYLIHPGARDVLPRYTLLFEHGDTPSYHMLTKSGAHSENLTPYAAVFPLQIFYRSISDVRVTSEHRKGMEKKDANQPRVAGTFQTNTWLDGKFSAGVSSALGAWEAGRQSMLAGEVGAPRGDSLPAQEHHPF